MSVVVGVLSGRRVVVAGAGLAGLTAAYELERRGAIVQVFEARDRLGGRVWTRRDANAAVHIEAGGELIDAEHAEVRKLAKQLQVPLVRILRGGFGLALAVNGSVHLSTSQTQAWRRLTRLVRPLVTALDAADQDWNSATAAVIASRSFADVLERRDATAEDLGLAQALRCFYLADPEVLSALVVVEQAAADEPPGRSTMFRAREGNDAIVNALAARLAGRVTTKRVVRAFTEDQSGLHIVVHDWEGRSATASADYVVVALPPPHVVECAFDPALPQHQMHALRTLRMGPATKLSMRFAEPWWRSKTRPWAYGSNLPTGAVWDGGEGQRGANVLTFLAGGSSSATLKRVFDAEGPRAIVEQLSWMGRPAPGVPIAPPVSWEQEEWSRGGYAVFTTSFDPRLRAALAASHGHIVFAGEHTSEQWQGFMNGAVESGQRAADEIEALERLRSAI